MAESAADLAAIRSSSSVPATTNMTAGASPLPPPSAGNGGNENEVRETLRLVEEVTYDLTSQSVSRRHPDKFDLIKNKYAYKEVNTE